MTRLRTTTIRLGLLGALAAGCDGVAPEETGPPATASTQAPTAVEATPQKPFSRTVVLLGAGGQHEIKTDFIDAEEIERMKVRRELRLANPSATEGYNHALFHADCNDARSMWLFDQANLTGNMLCLIRSTSESLGADDLGRFARPPVFQRTWTNAVRSFWAGTDPGYFRLGGSFNTPEAFQRDVRRDSVSSTVANAAVLGLSAQGATRPATFSGWSLNVSSCSCGSVAVSDGVTTNLFNVCPFRIQKGNGLLDCSYTWQQNMVFGRKYNTNFGNCDVAAVENHLIKPPSTWLNSATVHFYNGSCSDSEPFH